MARLYILSEEDIKAGKRPKTPREKQLWWKQACVVLTVLIILEHAAMLYFKVF